MIERLDGKICFRMFVSCISFTWLGQISLSPVGLIVFELQIFLDLKLL